MGRRVIAALGLGVLALAGCSPVASGEAAVSDEFRVSQSDVDALFAAKAAELGVEVTQGQVESGLEELAAQNGGREALDQAALQAGIAPASVEDFVRTSLLFTGIGTTLEPGGDAVAQRDVARAALAEYSESIDVQVAPRYGTWDDAQLSIVPGSSVVSPAPESAQP
jgi:hypothetical protein